MKQTKSDGRETSGDGARGYGEKKRDRKRGGKDREMK